MKIIKKIDCGSKRPAIIFKHKGKYYLDTDLSYNNYKNKSVTIEKLDVGSTAGMYNIRSTHRVLWGHERYEHLYCIGDDLALMETLSKLRVILILSLNVKELIIWQVIIMILYQIMKDGFFGKEE